MAVGELDDEAHLRFSAPDGVYGAAPAWRSGRHFLAALPWHPRLEAECKAAQVDVTVFLRAMALYAVRGDVETGRGISVANEVMARLLDCSARHVRNITRAARSLGVLHVAVAGTFMTGTQRFKVLDSYGKGHPSRTWRNLPNTTAATVPAELVDALLLPLRELRARLDAAARVAAAAASHWRACRVLRTGPFSRHSPALIRTGYPGPAVDNDPLARAIQDPLFRLPEGFALNAVSSQFRYYSPIFHGACGRTPAQNLAKQDSTSAPRPTENHQRQERSGLRRRVKPELIAYAKALRARLSGFEDLPPGFIANALSPYARAGLSPAELAAGLRTFMRAREYDLYRNWDRSRPQDQARYLIATLTRARDAGYLVADG